MQDIAKPDNLLEQLAEQLQTLLNNRVINQPLMVGIHTGGVWVANSLHNKLNLSEPLATLDISFYRDDFSRIGINPKVKPSSLPPQVENRHIILVDDVLHTGRTIRAAMNEIFDYGHSRTDRRQPRLGWHPATNRSMAAGRINHRRSISTRRLRKLNDKSRYTFWGLPEKKI